MNSQGSVRVETARATGHGLQPSPLGPAHPRPARDLPTGLASRDASAPSTTNNGEGSAKVADPTIPVFKKKKKKKKLLKTTEFSDKSAPRPPLRLASNHVDVAQTPPSSCLRCSVPGECTGPRARRPGVKALAPPAALPAGPSHPQHSAPRLNTRQVETSHAMTSRRYEWTGEILGTGAYSTVREAKHKGTGETFAVKQISKMTSHDLADDIRAQVFDEYDLLQRCRMDGKPHRETSHPPHSPPCLASPLPLGVVGRCASPRGSLPLRVEEALWS